MDREATLNRIEELGVLLVVRAEDATAAIKGIEAVVEGGIQAVEITFSVPIVFYGRDVVRITRYLRRLDRDADQPPPRLATELGHRFAGSIAVLQRRWRRRERSLTARLHSEAAIIDAIDGPILLVDDGRTVTRANDAARRTFGDQMVGRDLAVRASQ